MESLKFFVGFRPYKRIYHAGNQGDSKIITR